VLNLRGKVRLNYSVSPFAQGWRARINAIISGPWWQYVDRVGNYCWRKACAQGKSVLFMTSTLDIHVFQIVRCFNITMAVISYMQGSWRQ